MTVPTATDLTLILPDRIGSLGEAMSVFESAGVEILGHCGFPAWAGEGILHLIVDDPDAAVAALREAGISIREEREVVIVAPGAGSAALTGAFREIAAAGVNIDLTYALADGRLVVGVNNVGRAVAALEPPA